MIILHFISSHHSDLECTAFHTDPDEK